MAGDDKDPCFNDFIYGSMCPRPKKITDTIKLRLITISFVFSYTCVISRFYIPLLYHPCSSYLCSSYLLFRIPPFTTCHIISIHCIAGNFRVVKNSFNSKNGCTYS